MMSRHAAEVLAQADGPAERLARQVVDRGLAVVEVAVGDAAQELADQGARCLDALADRAGADLLVIADDHDLPAQVQRQQRQQVALAGLVDDDHVEARLARVEALGHARLSGMIQTGTASRARVSSSRAFALQLGRALARALADLALGVGPAVQRLPRLEAVRRSCASQARAIDKLDGDLAQLLLLRLEPAGQRACRSSAARGSSSCSSCRQRQAAARSRGRTGAPWMPRRRSMAAAHCGRRLRPPWPAAPPALEHRRLAPQVLEAAVLDV